MSYIKILGKKVEAEVGISGKQLLMHHNFCLISKVIKWVRVILTIVCVIIPE